MGLVDRVSDFCIGSCNAGKKNSMLYFYRETYPDVSDSKVRAGIVRKLSRTYGLVLGGYFVYALGAVSCIGLSDNHFKIGLMFAPAILVLELTRRRLKSRWGQMYKVYRMEREDIEKTLELTGGVIGRDGFE